MSTRSIRRTLTIAALLVGATATPAVAATMNGTAGPDVLTGTSAADTIYGRAGNDTLLGGRGADRIYGGHGADRIFPGDDRVKDVMYGGPGPDRIFVRYNGDTAYGGSGNDTVVVAKKVTSWTMANVYCGPGRDVVYAPSGWLVGGRTGCERFVWTSR